MNPSYFAGCGMGGRHRALTICLPLFFAVRAQLFTICIIFLRWCIMKKEDTGVWQWLHTCWETGLLSDSDVEQLSQGAEFAWQESHLSWEQVRQMFAFQIEPMNSANLCPTFTAVVNQSNVYRSILNNDISMHRRKALYATTLRFARERIAAQLNIQPSSLALVRNTTEANNILANGFTRWDGGEVLLWDENHPTNSGSEKNGAWRLRAQGNNNRGIQLFSLPNPATLTKEIIIKTIVEKVNAKTRLVSFTEVSNVTGIAIPTRDVIAAIRQKERELELPVPIHIHVDGAQSWGSLRLDLTALDCDSFSASSHKWFMGPFETGIFFMKDSRVQDFTLNNYGYAGDITIPDLDKIPLNASRFELLGQRDDANLYALLLAADLHGRINVNEQGRPDPSRLETRVRWLANELIKALTNSVRMQVQFITPSNADVRHGVVVFAVYTRGGQLVSPEVIYNRLYNDRHSSAKFASSYNDLGVRLCPHIMNSPEKIREVVTLIEHIVTNPNEETIEASVLAEETA